MISVLFVSLVSLHTRGVKFVPGDKTGEEEVSNAGGCVCVDVGDRACHQAFVVECFGILLQQGVGHLVNNAREVRIQERRNIWNSRRVLTN